MVDAEHNILVVTFPGNSSAAYEAFSKIGDLAGIENAAVVTRGEDGSLSVPQSTGSAGSGTLLGGAIGGLLGIIGGPLGVLFGWGAGALVGQASDVGDAVDASDGLAVLSRTITPGSNALVVDAVEPDPAVLDALLAEFGAQILRAPADEVAAEVEAAREQVDIAAKEARKARRAAHRTEFHDRVNKVFGGAKKDG